MKILHWNIESSGRGQSRRACIVEIIDRIIRDHSPEFIHICENCEGGGNSPLFGDEANSLKGYKKPFIGSYIIKNNKEQKSQALFCKTEPDRVHINSNERYITFDYNNEIFLFQKFIFSHISTGKRPEARKNSLNRESNNSSFFAIGDWNEGEEYKKPCFGCHSNTVNNRIHSAVVSPGLREQIMIRYNGNGQIELDSVCPFIESTYLTKRKALSGEITYENSGWNDFFISSPIVSNIKLYHFSFDCSVMRSQRGNKKKGIAPSNHTPIMVEIIK